MELRLMGLKKRKNPLIRRWMETRKALCRLKKLYTVPNQHISRKPSGSELLSTSVLAKGREFVYNELTVRSFSVV